MLTVLRSKQVYLDERQPTRLRVPVGRERSYALRVLYSMTFANMRTLAGAMRLSRSGVGSRRACFEVGLGALPKHWGFLVCTETSGLASALESLAPRPAEIEEALANHWIDDAFARSLAEPFRIDVNAPPDGTLLFARDLLVTVEGRLWQAWLAAHIAKAWLELPCTVATGTARLTIAAGKTDVLDATSSSILDQDLAVRVARAAYVGGCSATQNAIAASRLGLKLRLAKPPEAMSLADEVDIAPHFGWNLRSDLAATVVHLGPGDDEEDVLADQQRSAPEATEYACRSVAKNNADLHLRVDLVAIEEDGAWQPKLGAIPDMTAIPGRKLIVRYFDETGQPVADVIHGAAERMMPATEATLVGFLDVPAAIPIQGATLGKPLLEPLMRTGRAVGASNSAAKARADLNSALASLNAAYTRLRYPARFPVGLTYSLAALKTELVMRHAC